MRGFLEALRFMTALPLGRGGSFSAAGMAQYFPLVGLTLGVILALADALIRPLWSEPVTAGLLVFLLILLTGALQVDGLFSHRSRERILQIMKDSRIGVMGLAGVVSVLFIKWGGILDLEEGRTAALILVPAYSRGGLLLGMRFLPYGRPDGGMGTDFFQNRPGWGSFWGFGLLLPASFLLGLRGIVLVFSFAGISFLALWFLSRRIGCMTGDTLGAMNEVLEAGMFLALAAG